MQPTYSAITSNDDAEWIEVSKRFRWNIDKDITRGRQSDFAQKFFTEDISRSDVSSCPKNKKYCSARDSAPRMPVR